MDNNEQRKGGNNYDTLQSIVEQLEFCGYVTADNNNELKDNAAFKALKKLAIAESATTEDDKFIQPLPMDETVGGNRNKEQLIEEIQLSQEPQELLKDTTQDVLTIKIPYTGIRALYRKSTNGSLEEVVLRPLAMISDKLRIGIIK